MLKISRSGKGTFTQRLLQMPQINKYLFGYTIAHYRHAHEGQILLLVCFGNFRSWVQGDAQLQVERESFSRLKAITDSLQFPFFSSLASVWVCSSPQRLQNEVICAWNEGRTKNSFTPKQLHPTNKCKIQKTLMCSYQRVKIIDSQIKAPWNLASVFYSIIWIIMVPAISVYFSQLHEIR